MSNVVQGFPQLTSPAVSTSTGYFTQPWYQFMISIWQRSGTAQGSAVSPTGMIMSFGSPNLPVGWVLADGSEVSRVTYAALFSVIGTLWGAGDGTTTFNLPSLQNRFLIGYGTIGFANRGGNMTLTGGSSGIGYAALAIAIKT